MRATSSLFRQHLGWHFKRKWKIHGAKVINNTPAEEVLISLGKTVHNPDDILYEKRPFQKVNIVGTQDLEAPLDENHPLFKEKPCLVLADHNVVVEGLDQMKVLTKSVETEDGLPSIVENLTPKENSELNDKLVKRCILSSHVFDASQEKLPHIRDPNRPAFKFPRVYGISYSRRAKLLSSRLFQLCESLVQGSATQSSVIEDGKTTVFFDKENDLIQFDLTIDLAHIRASPLKPLSAADDTLGISLPDIYPFSSTITLEPNNFYEIRDQTFFNKNRPAQYVNTAITYFDETKVFNLYETPVTEKQILGRTLAKAFAVAAAQARHRFGDNVKNLPEPVTIQCIQTDGRWFHFLVFQLNTLNLNGKDGVKNIMWNIPRIQLFNSCTYIKGKPTLEGYNPEVFKRLLGFYKHSLH
ncbi:39S ribosomal protein L37, mitochondrial [Schistocerca cancellata]|uniref:39S ribosomal protein L37, mitochondrial n=1 Tax=Schistocerca cancellata TaxID=274614 RepID=UPI002118D2ED|nr:39S ribosomal protein L37, mitochondrial [Schistocerca cancellata]